MLQRVVWIFCLLYSCIQCKLQHTNFGQLCILGIRRITIIELRFSFAQLQPYTQLLRLFWPWARCIPLAGLGCRARKSRLPFTSIAPTALSKRWTTRWSRPLRAHAASSPRASRSARWQLEHKANCCGAEQRYRRPDNTRRYGTPTRPKSEYPSTRRRRPLQRRTRKP